MFALDADVVGLQGLGGPSSPGWGGPLQAGLESLGYQYLRGGSGDCPLALLVRRSAFTVQDHSCVSLQALVNKVSRSSSPRRLPRGV